MRAVACAALLLAALFAAGCGNNTLAACADCAADAAGTPADAPVSTPDAPAAACGSGCGSNEACCGDVCKPLGTLTDCSACGDTCGSGDFCDGAQCEAPTYPNFCANNTVYEIDDGIASDINAAALMGSTITANCPASITLTTENQTDAALIDQTTGEPLGGSSVTYVLAGGPFAQLAVKWLEQTAAVTSVYFAQPDSTTYAWMQRGDATPVASMPAASCTDHYDQFVVELVTDPGNGTLSLVGYGVCQGGRGTFGAAYYYANVMLPNAMQYPDSWYVFSWTDTNNDGVAGSGDTFTVLAHGM